MSTPRPNFLDRLAVKIYPRYLYPSQLCQTLATVNIGITHKVPEIKPYWKIMDHLYLKKDSTLKYLGLARNLEIAGDFNPYDSIFELVSPLVDEDKSYGKHASGGDIVCLSPTDRRFIVAAPDQSGPSKEKIYFTAADQ